MASRSRSTYRGASSQGNASRILLHGRRQKWKKYLASNKQWRRLLQRFHDCEVPCRIGRIEILLRGESTVGTVGLGRGIFHSPKQANLGLLRRAHCAVDVAKNLGCIVVSGPCKPAEWRRALLQGETEKGFSS